MVKVNKFYVSPEELISIYNLIEFEVHIINGIQEIKINASSSLCLWQYMTVYLLRSTQTEVTFLRLLTFSNQERCLRYWDKPTLTTLTHIFKPGTLSPILGLGNPYYAYLHFPARDVVSDTGTRQPLLRLLTFSSQGRYLRYWDKPTLTTLTYIFQPGTLSPILGLGNPHYAYSHFPARDAVSDTGTAVVFPHGRATGVGAPVPHGFPQLTRVYGCCVHVHNRLRGGM